MNRRKRIIISALYIFFISGIFCAYGAEIDVIRKQAKIRQNGNLGLFFADAETGKAVKGLEVTIDAEDDLEDGNIFVTGKDGFIEFSVLPDGDYTFYVSKEGYAEEELEFRVRAGFILNYRFVVTKIPEPGSLRIVLKWNEKPYDLDLHLQKEGGYHISYWAMHAAEDGSASLDVDKRDGWGPETITVNKWTFDKTYQIYVIDYSNKSRSSSNQLAGSGASVSVYNENGFVRTFYVPGGKGVRWDVCSIKNGTVTPIETLSASE
ncbi:MAG: hypothetical protein J6Y16_06170 [Treponema sp.]|nr:hypothetical protein [Treponema sp.]